MPTLDRHILFGYLARGLLLPHAYLPFLPQHQVHTGTRHGVENRSCASKSRKDSEPVTFMATAPKWRSITVPGKLSHPAYTISVRTDNGWKEALVRASYS